MTPTDDERWTDPAIPAAIPPDLAPALAPDLAEPAERVIRAAHLFIPSAGGEWMLSVMVTATGAAVARLLDPDGREVGRTRPVRPIPHPTAPPPAPARTAAAPPRASCYALPDRCDLDRRCESYQICSVDD